MAYSTLLVQKENGVATIKLNRPETMNAVNYTMVVELTEALREIKNDPEVRVVLLTHDGKAFSSGGDVEDMTTGFNETSEALRRMRRVGEMAEALITIPKPVVCGVNGIAVGAGFNMAIACDIVIASEKAKFSQIFSQVGLVPDSGGSYLLPRLIGRAKAKELIFTGRMISAQEAFDLGLVTKLVSVDQFEQEVAKTVEQIANAPTKALVMAKLAINQSFETDLKTALQIEAFGQTECTQTEDYREGQAAFLQKRKPQFKGQ